MSGSDFGYGLGEAARWLAPILTAFVGFMGVLIEERLNADWVFRHAEHPG
ncbi:hypothetical protein MKK63_21210 [Methylobacterium sp. J-088]|nr:MULTISPECIES: hypothetical protein [unclassified Methylobacterium]MCJ2065214.1 hypothetical protein [Methylobacterium sp. J-088]